MAGVDEQFEVLRNQDVNNCPVAKSSNNSVRPWYCVRTYKNSKLQQI